ncbi:IS1182 family transposase [Antarcticibacterium flavum]|uniref:IS1182 family transposase n=1 Tax=Antarcticibacterium flavum TaxID=2058175 RepID=A0A5B7X562_9FLAO|nr:MULTISPECIES: IS1182 family transposase [Antarcticibacterium]MCM4161948.1 IS1182 family transposase [Antarcticibacterium sp. W02-3]QCY68650.1 IS1182 family transposase [Antarcticibacterium flavum]QCY68962.1 IS1182 family transposase [Antarcticibacterium flavum]QCY69624.1 IS1182 family transposase [Antarcticibacterium flavum]QCY69842.1 IS1182 family transposase [Antarcticibacterium flavum]
MLLPQQKMQLSAYSDLYALIIPKDNLLRKINELIDFTFIYDELVNNYCLNNGRNAESPIRMFKYLLLKTIYTISDVDVVERSRYDMSFKYFLEMAPEDAVINSSSLTKFRKLRLKDTDLLNLLINKTVSISIEKGIITSKSLIVDATHSLSRSNPYSALEVLRERSKLLRKVVYAVDENMKERFPEKNASGELEKELAYCKELEKCIESDQTLSLIPAVKEKLNLLKETVEDTQENYILSKDTDAKTGHKSADSKFFGYKTHLAMTEERIITAAVVTSGEKGDGPELPMLVKISQNNGIQVDTVIGDSAYSGKENLKLKDKDDQNIKIVAKLNPAIAQGSRKNEDKFDYNKDADMFVCPAGHLAIRKARQGKKERGKNQVDTYYFDVEKCKTCPLRDGCYKPGAKTKTYSVSIKSSLHQEQIVFQESEYYKEKSKHRYKIEAKNSELKNVHGYDRAIAYGINSMQMQGALAIFTVNLKRILKLTI